MSEPMTVRPLMVLLVDDEEDDRRQIQETLAEAQFAVQLAVLGDGDEALKVLRQEDRYADTPPPDLVLLDHDLGLLAAIKDDERIAGIPIVLLGTSEEGHEPQRATELGVHGYVRKPLSLDDFLSVVAFSENV